MEGLFYRNRNFFYLTLYFYLLAPYCSLLFKFSELKSMNVFNLKMQNVQSIFYFKDRF